MSASSRVPGPESVAGCSPEEAEEKRETIAGLMIGDLDQPVCRILPAHGMRVRNGESDACNYFCKSLRADSPAMYGCCKRHCCSENAPTSIGIECFRSCTSRTLTNAPLLDSKMRRRGNCSGVDAPAALSTNCLFTQLAMSRKFNLRRTGETCAPSRSTRASRCMYFNPNRTCFHVRWRSNRQNDVAISPSDREAETPNTAGGE